MVILRALFGNLQLFRRFHGGFWTRYQGMSSKRKFWLSSQDPSPGGAYYVLGFEHYKLHPALEKEMRK